MAVPVPSLRFNASQYAATLTLAAEGAVGWLIGLRERHGSSDFAVTVTSAVRCIHLSPSAGTSTDVRAEAADLRHTFPSGLEIVGAFFLAPRLGKKKEEIDAAYGKLAEGSLQLAAEIRAAEAGQKLKYPDDSGLVTLAVSADGSASRAFYSLGTFKGVGEVASVEVVSGGVPDLAKEVWRRHVLLRCQLDIRLPLYLNSRDPSPAGQFDPIRASQLSPYKRILDLAHIHT